MHAASSIDQCSCRVAYRYATGVDDPVGPPRETRLDGRQPIVTVYRPSINCSFRREVIRRRGDDNIITQKGNCRAIRRV